MELWDYLVGACHMPRTLTQSETPPTLSGATLCPARCVAHTLSLSLHLCDKDHNSLSCRLNERICAKPLAPC